MSVKVIDRGWNKIVAELAKAGGSFVKVGYPEEKSKVHKGEGQPIEMAQLAAVHEFGSPSRNIPARPFMAQTFDKHVAEVNKRVSEIKDRIISGQVTAKQAWAQLGAWYKGMMQKEIRDGGFEPNKLKTIERKGSDRPLIDTGQLRQSIDFEVVGRAAK